MTWYNRCTSSGQVRTPGDRTLPYFWERIRFSLSRLPYGDRVDRMITSLMQRHVLRGGCLTYAAIFHGRPCRILMKGQALAWIRFGCYPDYGLHRPKPRS